MPRTPILFLMVIFGAACAMPGVRVKRGYNGFESSFGRSDERDASVSGEGCGGGGGYSRGYSNSGSRELAYSRDGRQGEGRDRGERGGRSFTRAAASASAVTFTQNEKLRKANTV